MSDLDHFNTTGVEKAFRPLLDEIDFPNLDLCSVPIVFYHHLEQYLPLLRGKKCRLVLTAQNNGKNDEAYAIFSILDDTYTLTICMSKDMFNGSSYDDPMIRKIIGTHEFLHCISALFSVPVLMNKKKASFLRECKTKMMFEMLSIDHIKSSHSKNLMGPQNRLFIREKDYFYPNTIFFSDDHFRLSLDRAPLKYNNLYERFLLPKDEYETFFDRKELRHLKSLISTSQLPEAYKLAESKVDKIADDMHLEKDFVYRRMTEILLSYAL